MKFGVVPVDPPLILAPMEGVTDLYFRRLVRRAGGCGLTVTEFVPAEGLRRDVPRVIRMADFDPEEHPVAVQLYGRAPEAMAQGARIVEDIGADLLDLNMGCPSKKVCAKSGGSALMKDPELAQRIIAAMRAAVSIPFTVKMRSGWDHDNKNAPAIAKMCQEEGVDGVAVHWRTRTDGYKGTRELDTIAAVKDQVSIPVVANGDIVDVSSALQTLAATGCDGLMIGRGAVRNPWIFREIGAAMQGQELPSVAMSERKRLLLGYFEDLRANFHSENAALGRVKKVARYLTHGLVGGAALRKSVFHSMTFDEAKETVESWFDRAAA